MKELNEIDKLICSSLADYKPVPENKSKERFLASASQLWQQSGSSGTIWKTVLLVAALLIGSAGVFYYYPPAKQTPVNSRSIIVGNDLAKENSPMANTPETAREAKNTNSNHLTDKTNDNTKLPQHATSPAMTDKKRSSGLSNNTETTLQATSGDNEETAAPIHAGFANPDKRETNKNVSFIHILEPYSYGSVTDFTETAPLLIEKEYTTMPLPHLLQDKKEYKPSVSKNQMLNITYSVYYRPELVFNIIDNNKLVHNIGVDVHFKLFNDKYLVRTGIGTSLSKGYNEYAVLYNEYLGSYESLDSVTFTWDENHYNLIPTYHMSEREVFDTAIQTVVSRVYKRYTYLQIPLILGYDFITNEKYSIGVRFGPTFSALLSNKTISDDYDPGKHKILQINQITPDRINTNWLLMAGFNIGIYSKKRLFYEIEPQFSYFFNSVYQKYDSSNPPFSVGLRISVGIK